MRINIAATHRFHVLDLARELNNQGHDVLFYSYVPKKRCEKFGLKKNNCHSLLLLAIPFFIMQRILPHKMHNRIIHIRNIILDYYLSIFMRPCDIFICLGSVYYKSIIKASQDFQATTILEWGSKHIIEQLKQFNKTNTYPIYSLKKDLKQYEIVDYISIPARHVQESFLKHGISSDKLIINPYGVNLHDFRPTQCTNQYDLIFVGGWRKEKGCDLIIDLCMKYKYTFLHVGSIVNMSFPNIENMKHIDSVNQKDLYNYYKQAKVFIIPSRSEGLALVQAQAIACGLPIVCSKNTGGSDLNHYLSDKRWIIEMEYLTIDSLHKSIEKALTLANKQKGERNYAAKDINNLSWEKYGERYNYNIECIIKQKHNDKK